MAEPPAPSEKSSDLNILSQGGERASVAEVRADLARRRMPGRTLALVFLGLAGLPMIYAAALPPISRDLTAAWFQAWVHATSGVAWALGFLFPGLAAGGERIYARDPEALGAFLNFASVDLLCVLGIALIVFVLKPSLRLIPKQGSAQLRYLENMAKGFPLGRTASAPRVGGAAGGLVFAMFIGLALTFVLYFSYIYPLLGDGQIFVDAHSHCAQSVGSGRNSDCIRYAFNDLDQTIWKLGWMSSLAAVLFPVGVWMAFANLHYAVWLALGRPSRA